MKFIIDILFKLMSENDKLEPHILKRFQCIKKIGSGAYGVVWKVMDKQTHKFYALKKNFDAFQNSTDAQRTFRQIMYLKKFEHPHIIQAKQVIGSMNNKDIYILFEYLDIDLYTLIKENILSERHKKYIIYQIAKAIYYLHTAQLIHRDIKPSNVLVNQDCHAKICDFGLVRSVFQEQEAQLILTQYIATRWYRAPQILLGSKKYSKPSDVWSFGCMIGELMIGKPMFPGTSTLNQIERVVTWTGPPNNMDLKSLQTNFGKQMLDILTKIKQKNKKQWFSSISQDILDLISKTLLLNPQKRPTMLQVLKHPFLRQFYSKDQIIQAKNPIIINVEDNKKLSLSQYRLLIYNLVKDYEQKNKMTSFFQNKQIDNNQQNKTLYKNRLIKNIARSASKNKDQSNPKNTQKESNTPNIKKKYQSSNSKGKQETAKPKYVKTEEIEQKHQLFPKRKKSQNVANYLKYYSSDKKKKSVSLYEQNKNSEILAKYMYEHRKI